MVDEVISQLGLDPGMNCSPNAVCDRARDELGMRSAGGIGAPTLHLHELFVRTVLEHEVGLAGTIVLQGYTTTCARSWSVWGCQRRWSNNELVVLPSSANTYLRKKWL